MKFFAYELLTDGAADIGVDTQLSTLQSRLVRDINNLIGAGDAMAEDLTIGFVEADSVDEAIKQVRSGYLKPFTL